MTPSERLDVLWTFLWNDLRHNATGKPTGEAIIARHRPAIEREAQGIPPSEALRAALTDIMSMTVDHLDEPRMRVIHKVAQRAALAATPSGGIPLIDVELVKRALDATKSCTDQCDHDGVEWTWSSLETHADQFAAEYTRLASQRCQDVK